MAKINADKQKIDREKRMITWVGIDEYSNDDDKRASIVSYSRKRCSCLGTTNSSVSWRQVVLFEFSGRITKIALPNEAL